MAGERTEQATQHRREKARKEGDILHSRELAAAAGTLAGVMALGAFGGRAIEAWRGAFDGFLALGAAVELGAGKDRADAGRHAPADARGAWSCRPW